MKSLQESSDRDIEFGTHQDKQGDCHWAYYPKMGTGVVKRGIVKETRETAIAVCKAAIDN